ncbi:uncharacterized protein LOC117175534 [Belonocnema kinseyi]|uniref:uncharacterized protein LOC117175534 n=1 Tax=Belonocnema kinseyi TaxID=2817044 RepID=UPI00143D5B3E|nr:uncharacterized protein LOC117175534 [Belonocnema kinseyi]
MLKNAISAAAILCCTHIVISGRAALAFSESIIKINLLLALRREDGFTRLPEPANGVNSGCCSNFLSPTSNCEKNHRGSKKGYKELREKLQHFSLKPEEFTSSTRKSSCFAGEEKSGETS